MALCTLCFGGKAIRKASAMNVIFPDNSDVPGPYPVLYLLGGMADDHTIWCRQTSIERYIQDLPLVAVMPSGGRGWYTDAVVGEAYEQHIMKDVIGFVERTLNVRTDREGRAITGLSMGGYGAMKLALKYPDVFGSVAAHLGAYDVVRSMGRDENARAERARIFGDDPVGGSNDVFALAKRLDPARAPRIRFDAALDDGLIVQSRAFHEHLESLGITHVYAENPGGHTWAFVDEHVKDSIAFVWQTLGPAPKG